MFLLLKFYPFTLTIVPLGPGTLPFTNITFFSTSTFTTFKFCTVAVTFPICPGNFLPLSTLDGVAHAPIDPGLLWYLEPCDIGPLACPCLLITPWNPLPLVVP